MNIIGLLPLEIFLPLWVDEERKTLLYGTYGDNSFGERSFAIIPSSWFSSSTSSFSSIVGNIDEILLDPLFALNIKEN